MSGKAQTDSRQQCIIKCRDAFITYTETKPVGGVEALRICREACDNDADSKKQSSD